MFITERIFFLFNIVNIYFVDEPLIMTSPDYDVIIYHTYKNWGEIEGYEKNKHLTTKIDLSQDMDVIWNKFSRQHKRHIKRAEKNRVTVTISHNYEKFYPMYKKLFNQKNYSDIFGLTTIPLQFMQKYTTLFIAENHGELLGGNIYFHDEHNALFVENAFPMKTNTTENKKQTTDANCYLHWKAMEHFKNINITNYELGVVSQDDIKISQQINGGVYFKRGFGGDVISRYRYRKFNSRFNKLLFTSWNCFRTCK
jgi:hypothetical protein